MSLADQIRAIPCHYIGDLCSPGWERHGAFREALNAAAALAEQAVLQGPIVIALDGPTPTEPDEVRFVQWEPGGEVEFHVTSGACGTDGFRYPSRARWSRRIAIGGGFTLPNQRGSHERDNAIRD